MKTIIEMTQSNEIAKKHICQNYDMIDQMDLPNFFCE